MKGLFSLGKNVYIGGKGVVTGGWKAFGGLGAHAKGLAVGSAIVYGGWQKLATGRFPGEDIVRKGADVVGQGVDVVSKGFDAAGKGLDLVNKGLDKTPDLIRDTHEALTGGGIGEGGSDLSDNLFGGIKDLVGGLFGGGGMSSMLGLAAGAYLLFGGFGWMGKIGGILLAALSLGLFGSHGQQQTPPQVAVAPERSREHVCYPDMSMEEESIGSVVHRSR